MRERFFIAFLTLCFAWAHLEWRQMDTENGDRRTFFVTALYGLWALIAATLSLPAAVYLLLPPKLRNGAVWTEAGDVSKIAPNSPVEMVFRRNRIDGWRIQS